MDIESSPQSVPSTVAHGAAIVSLMACAAIVSLALFGVLTHPLLASAAVATVLSLALASLLLHHFAARPHYRRGHEKRPGWQREG